ncbi:MAG: dihydrofolate reductase family protein [Solirubrobacteraceae bacterium]|nr:dihydrofolate reductase family protein [Solirubrobacteraceae bacterium]
MPGSIPPDPATAARNEPPVALRRLLPERGELTADELVGELRPWELATPERPHVAVNMVQTCDGRATVQGRTAPISSLADRQLFHALRTRVDAVMIGAETLRVERYGRIVPDAARREQRRRSGLRPDPLAIVVSGSLKLSADLPLLQDPASRVVIVTASEHSLDGVRADVEYLRSAPIDLSAVFAQLRSAHGVRAILGEGGPHLNASLLARGLIDELFVTTVGVLAGATGALSIMDGAPLQAPVALSPRWLLEHEGELFARYAVGSVAADAPSPA